MNSKVRSIMHIDEGLFKGRSARYFFAFGLAMCLLLLSSLAILMPEASEETVYKKGSTIIDASHTDQGYFMIKHKPFNKKIKVRVSLGKNSLRYDLNSDGEFEVFPLQMGDGKYKVEVFEQVSGDKYSAASTISMSVKLADPNLPFLYPSQYVNYVAESTAVAKAAELCANCATDQEKMDAVVKFVVNNFSYDFIRAMEVQKEKGYLPVVDSILAEKKGICFDMSALVACMLRSQGIPTKLVIGFADKQYHAWNEIFVGEKWRGYDTTAEIASMRVKKYTVERVY